MAIERLPKGIEHYTAAKEILLEDDRLEIDIKITGWSKMLRIRALTFGQMEKINKLSKDKDTGKLDSELWTYHTISEGVIIPYFTITMAKELADNNGAFVRELADEIWELGRISRVQWDKFIEQHTKLEELEKTGNPDANK
jgi:hypothetical protein